MDVQRETRPCSKRHGFENGPRYYRGHTEERTPDGREKKKRRIGPITRFYKLVLNLLTTSRSGCLMQFIPKLVKSC